MIEFRKTEQKYVDEAAMLAKEEWEAEYAKCPQIVNIYEEERIENLIARLFYEKYGYLALEDGKLIGYMAFTGPWDDFHGKVKGVFSPLGGSAFSGKNREKLASLLLEKVTADLVRDGIGSFGLSRYAHDEETGRCFILNGFGIRCSDAIMKVSRKEICTITYDDTFFELEQYERDLVRDFRRDMVKHLSKAPTFVPTNIEFYDKWFEEGALRLFVLINEEEKEIIGFMAITTDGENFLTEYRSIYNICGAYVEERYRGKGAANLLLEFVRVIAAEEGMEYLGVDYETMNPTALRFWRKYFESYTYSYVRRIDERIFEYEKYRSNY